MSKSSPRPAAPQATPRLERVLHAIALAGVYGGLLMPLVFTGELVIFPYVFPKLLFLQLLVELTLPAWLVLALLQPRFRPRRSWVLATLAAYAVALTLSAAFAFDRHRALWGSQERMNGLFQLLHFFGWFLMAASLVRDRPAWRRLLQWQVGLGFALAVSALLQLPIPTLLGPPSDDRVSGLLGNPIFSATYQLFDLYFIALLRVDERSAARRRLLLFAALTSAGAIWAAGSRGPLLGLLAGATASGAAWAVFTRRWRLLAWVGLGLGGAAAAWAVVAFALIPLPALEAFWRHHASLRHIFLADGDPARRLLWAAAFRGFLDHPLLGWGLAGFDFLFDVHYPPSFLCGGVPGTWQDSAHSLVFDQLATNGLLGLCSFAALWASVLIAPLRAFRRGEMGEAAAALLFGLPVAYLAQGLFVFDSPGVSAMAFLLCALAANASRAFSTGSPLPQPASAGQGSARAPAALPAFLALELAAALLCFRTSVQPALASSATQRAHAAFARSDFDSMLASAREAAAIPTPYLEDQVYVLSLDLGALASGRRLERWPRWRELLEVERGAAARMLANHPAHLRQRTDQANLLAQLGHAARDPALLAEAMPLYEQLIAESPQRQQHRFDYAHALFEQGKVGASRAQLLAALAADGSSGESRWRLGRFLWRAEGKPREGAALMTLAMTGTCAYALHSAQELRQLAEALSLLDDRESLRGLVKRVEELPPEDRPTVVHLAVAGALEEAGLLPERDSVLRLARERDPSVAVRLAPLFEGRVATMAEAIRMTTPSAAPDSTRH